MVWQRVDNDIPNGIGMIYRLCRYDILHRSMIYSRVSENIKEGEKAMKKFIKITLSLALAVILLVTAMPIYALEEVTVKEIEDLREENVKHFDMGDGTYKAVVYSEPVHRKDSEGKWTDIDNTLSEVKENGMTQSPGHRQDGYPRIQELL